MTTNQSPIRRVVLQDAERLLTNKDKRGMMAAVTAQDRHRVGSTWVLTWDHWQHGQPVTEVEHFRKHHTFVGETLLIASLKTMQPVCQVMVEAITMIDCALMTDQQAQVLGYASAAAFRAARPEVAEIRAWLVTFSRVSAVTPDPPAAH